MYVDSNKDIHIRVWGCRETWNLCGYLWQLPLYQPQQSWAKVMFLQASVNLPTRGVSASVHAGIHPPGSRHPPEADTPLQEQTPPSLPRSRHPQSRHPPDQTPTPQGLITPPGTKYTPPGLSTPPRNRLRHTVNEQPVCILLVWILVYDLFRVATFQPRKNSLCFPWVFPVLDNFSLCYFYVINNS